MGSISNTIFFITYITVLFKAQNIFYIYHCNDFRAFVTGICASNRMRIAVFHGIVAPETKIPLTVAVKGITGFVHLSG